MKQNILDVRAVNYESKYFRLAEDFLFFERFHQWTQTNEVDAFPDFWSLAIGDFPPGQLHVRAKGKMVEISGFCAVWVPPFSIIDWHPKQEFIKWSCFTSTSRPPQDLPKFPCLFSLEEKIINSSINQDTIFDLVRGAATLLDLSKEEISDVLAQKVRSIINDNFSSEISTADISKILGVRSETIDRHFKKSYSISPIAYRNTLRLFHAQMQLLLDSKSGVGRIAHTAGYNDISVFNKHFRRLMGASPSQFKKNQPQSKAQNLNL